jgi:ferrochelatase
VPEERVREVAAHYRHFGGVSPANAQSRDLVAALSEELARHGPPLAVYWGSRHGHPRLVDTLRRMADDGVRRALAFVASAYAAHPGCRQYLDDLARARAEVGERAPEVHKLRLFYNHPGFVEPLAESAAAALDRVPEPRRAAARLVFTAHSIPRSLAATCEYEAQLRETAGLVAFLLGRPQWSLVYQSRSGLPSQPWLDPDIVDHLRALAAEGVKDVVVAPIGFASDDLEVLYDLDLEAKSRAMELGINMVRAATVGTHPRFVRMVRELAEERLADEPHRLHLGTRGPAPDECPADCCPPARG